MPPEPKPSGTVVVVREVGELQVLLLQRSPSDGKPGPWVFPGGKVDAPDRLSGAPALEDARRAAVREAAEEAALALDARALVPISRWITPEIAPKRFDTWFFLSPVDADAQVKVDGQEMCEHRWLSPAEALRGHERLETRLAPPTFVTVTWLREFRESATALREFASRELVHFRPRITRLGEGACMLYPGDAGYETNDPEAAGARHRLLALKEGWRYERD